MLLHPVQVKFVLLSQPRLPESASDSLDFVILYDVLVHVDLHITNKYIREIARVLKPGGKAFLSTANFLSSGVYLEINVPREVPKFANVPMPIRVCLDSSMLFPVTYSMYLYTYISVLVSPPFVDKARQNLVVLLCWITARLAAKTLTRKRRHLGHCVVQIAPQSDPVSICVQPWYKNTCSSVRAKVGIDQAFHPHPKRTAVLA